MLCQALWHSVINIESIILADNSLCMNTSMHLLLSTLLLPGTVLHIITIARLDKECPVIMKMSCVRIRAMLFAKGELAFRGLLSQIIA